MYVQINSVIFVIAVKCWKGMYFICSLFLFSFFVFLIMLLCMSWHYLQTEIIICALRVNWSLSRLCQDTLRWYTYAYKVSLLTLTSWHAVIYYWCILLLKVNHSIIDVNVCVYGHVCGHIWIYMNANVHVCMWVYVCVYMCISIATFGLQ